MPYFIIVPIYLILLLLMGTAALATRLHAPWRPACAYLTFGSLGTLPGFILCNALVTIAGLLTVWAGQSPHLPEWLRHATGMATFLLLFVGPFAASLIGVIGGFAGGVWLVRRKSAKAGEFPPKSGPREITNFSS